jgi:hypothetical protein
MITVGLASIFSRPVLVMNTLPPPKQPTPLKRPAPLLVALPWLLTSVVAFLALFVWGSSLAWHFNDLSIYQIFPVLGLLAWSIMWSHYIANFLRDSIIGGRKPAEYFRFTGYAVLILIVLHPGLLIYQRFRDGFGLPPGSYETYVAPSMAWITLLGTLSLLVFLAYEFKRWYENLKWWKYVVSAGDIAMLAIFYHGLELGTQLHVQWFRYVWYFYGICLAAVLLVKYLPKLQQPTPSSSR